MRVVPRVLEVENGGKWWKNGGKWWKMVENGGNHVETI